MGRKRKNIIQTTTKTKINQGLVFGLIIIAFGFILYSGIFDNSSHFDDAFWQKHGAIKDLSEPGAIFGINPLRSVIFFSLAIQYSLHGFELSWYYLFNILVHIINSLLVYSLVVSTLSTPLIKDKGWREHAKLIALFCALIYISHPIMTQAVAYIYQRLALLATMFYLTTILFYARARLSENMRARYFILTGLSLILGLFTKEITFTAPMMIVLYELIFFRKRFSFRNKYFIIACFTLLAAAAAFLYSGLVQRISTNTFSGELLYYTAEKINSYNYLLTEFRVVADYIRMLFLPVAQNLDYEYALSTSLIDSIVILSLLLHIAVISFGIYIFKKNRIVTFAILWFYLTLSVESSIIPIKDVINEHRLYLPMFGFALLLATTLYKLLAIKSIKPFVAVSAILILICTGLTLNRLQVWENEFTLWNDVIEKSPGKARGYVNRGEQYKKAGKFQLALSDLNKAIELDTLIVNAYLNRAAALSALRRYGEAIKDFDRYIYKAKGNSIGYLGRADAWLAKGKYRKAIKDYSVLIRRRKGDYNSFFNRAICFERLNKFNKAAKDYIKAAGFNGKYYDIYIRIGDMFFGNQNYKRAIDNYTEAIKFNPRGFDAFNNRATTYFFINNYADAAKDFEKALNINPNFAKGYINLGLTYAARNRYDDAIDTYSRLLKINPDNPEALYHRSNAYIDKGELIKARSDLEKAVRNYPKFKQAKKKLEELASGKR